MMKKVSFLMVSRIMVLFISFSFSAPLFTIVNCCIKNSDYFYLIIEHQDDSAYDIVLIMCIICLISTNIVSDFDGFFSVSLLFCFL